MNPELQKQLSEMLARLMDATQNAASWSVAQAPLLVAEKIRFGRAEETVWMVLSLLLFCVGAVIVFKVFKWRMRGSGDWFDVWFSYIALLPGIVATGGNMHDFLLVWFAPRLYIVEWLTSLVKKG